jgi:hypothetical protein
MTHLFLSVFPAVAAVRAAHRWFRRRGSNPARSDVALPAPWVNRALGRLSETESRLLGRWNLPIGSSLLGLVRKEPAS